MTDLIRPSRSGRDLIDEMAATRPVAGELAVWWLGQSGFLIRTSRGTVVIDPYLSEHLTAKYAETDRPHVRMTEAPLRGEDLAGVDLILASHKHSDHLDPGTIPGLMAASPRARLVLPAAIVGHAEGLGLPTDRIVGIEAGATFRDPGGIVVRAIPSAHEGLDTDASGRHLYVGFVIEVDGRRLYHSGDSVLYPGLADRLGPDRLDVAFLPINGRDPARGVPGNMTAAEAIDLAARIRPRFVVPHHYEMFTFNTVPVSAFRAEAARLPEGVSARVLRCAERWIVPPSP